MNSDCRWHFFSSPSRRQSPTNWRRALITHPIASPLSGKFAFRVAPSINGRAHFCPFCFSFRFPFICGSLISANSPESIQDLEDVSPAEWTSLLNAQFCTTVYVTFNSFFKFPTGAYCNGYKFKTTSRLNYPNFITILLSSLYQAVTFFAIILLA